MKQLNPYLYSIEEIRKDKHMTMADLTNGIMSIRTYQRYISENTQISLSKLNELVVRLNMNLIDILYYNMYVKKDGMNFNQYYLKAFNKNYQHFPEHYNHIQKNGNFTEEELILMNAIYKRYEVEMSISSNTLYRTYLEENVHIIFSKKINSIYSLAFMMLYIEEFPDNTLFSLEDMLIELTRKIYTKQKVMLYFLLTDNALHFAMHSGFRDLDVFKDTLDMFYNLAFTYSAMSLLNDSNLFYAYIECRKSQIDSFDQHLFQYLNGRVILREENEYLKDKTNIYKLFHIDIGKFQKKMIRKLCQSSQEVELIM